MPLTRAAAPTPDDHPSVQRRYPRDGDGLVRQLDDADAGVRRWAARDLARHPDAVGPLAARLAEEAAPEVREAILDSLLAIGGDQVAEAMLALLRSEDTALRNGAVVVLQQLPQPVGRHMRLLLADPDADVRIMALDVLQALAHADAPIWLGELLQRERHVNVVGAAVDRLAEIGTADMLPLLDAVKCRFEGEPYIQFAIDTAIRRISGGPRAA